MELRFERKYTAPGERARELECFLKLHPVGIRRAHPPRWVNSVYLDTPDFADYHSHVEGVARRSKLRVRWYGDLEGAVVAPQLELKLKINAQNGKRRSRLEDADVSLAALPAQMKRWLAGVENSDPLKARTLNMRAVALVRYHRSYYQVAGSDCRLTIDTKMSWCGLGAGGASFRLTAKVRSAVLELKYVADRPDDLVSEITDRFPVRNTRHSKYLRAVRAGFPW